MLVNNCVVEWCVAGNLIIGAVLGVLGTLLVNRLAKCRQKRILRKRFGKADGTNYKGYGYETQSVTNQLCEYKREQAIESRELNLGVQTSQAMIKYERDNILTIRVDTFKGGTEEVESVWEGTITMQVPDSGTIVWRYVKPQDSEHFFGFKRCIVREEESKVYVYLIEEIVKGMGKEVLIADRRRSQR